MNEVQTAIEETFQYWIGELRRAFPELEPFNEPQQFIDQHANHIRKKENAALQRAINVLDLHKSKRLKGHTYSDAIVLVRSCMKGD